MYANYPIIWYSKLQTEIALSTTESEYVALLQSLRDVIPLIGLLGELKKIISTDDSNPKIHCIVFKDNKGCIDLANSPRVRPSTKHIALKYHYFRSFIGNTMSVHYIETTEQIADIFTKSLNDTQFCKLSYCLNGW